MSSPRTEKPPKPPVEGTTDTLFSLSKILSLTHPCIDLLAYSMAIASHLEDIPDLSVL